MIQSQKQFFYSSNPNSHAIFEKFLDNTSSSIRDICVTRSTQINESFNHHCEKLLKKLYAYRGSYLNRLSIAVTDWNEKNYVFEILNRINSNQKLYSIFYKFGKERT